MEHVLRYESKLLSYIDNGVLNRLAYMPMYFSLLGYTQALLEQGHIDKYECKAIVEYLQKYMVGISNNKLVN